jgi:hypothetical protein
LQVELQLKVQLDTLLLRLDLQPKLKLKGASGLANLHLQVLLQLSSLFLRLELQPKLQLKVQDNLQASVAKKVKFQTQGATGIQGDYRKLQLQVQLQPKLQKASVASSVASEGLVQTTNSDIWVLTTPRVATRFATRRPYITPKLQLKFQLRSVFGCNLICNSSILYTFSVATQSATVTHLVLQLHLQLAYCIYLPICKLSCNWEATSVTSQIATQSCKPSLSCNSSCNWAPPSVSTRFTTQKKSISKKKKSELDLQLKL